MALCDECGAEENMPYQCRHCGGTFCASHRLPEAHDCPGLEDWGDPGGVFDSGFDDSVTETDQSLLDRIGLSAGPGGPLAYFRGNMTYVFLALMWITFVLEFLVPFPMGGPTWGAIFTISEAHPLYVWTWVTSIFAHGGFNHILGNSIVIFFFGRITERYIGSRDFTLLFLGSGILAGLGQMAIFFVQPGDPGAALGASGAALAIMGVLTILNPSLRVYLYFIVPIPLWVITIFYAGISVTGVLSGMGNGVADGAHLVGLVIGLLYGLYVRDRVSLPGELQLGGGGGPGRRRGGGF
ncbi:rhomboid family intramembrane serine protease [Halococcoides cellulosivorans]|uniref:Rhomboid family intramembrane serine protease n=1 Tax=Halococcoides cellulosivorans TaxID=1679096 RepID=A0A2R4WZ29_9EURY|nr:rhomboid family intramembrane serine protease [Halococcoides cellulosivorans]AWB26790.1 rhomboid family intramembrane serine protease [Halococcoides cellulosivorans]